MSEVKMGRKPTGKGEVMYIPKPLIAYVKALLGIYKTQIDTQGKNTH